jgi:hypothetical protein
VLASSFNIFKHHLCKLIIRNFTISVGINLLDNLINYIIV